MNSKVILFIILSIFLIGCAQEGSPGLASGQFLGGSVGITPEFIANSPPAEVYDGGDFPFDVVVKLTNQGEFSVPAPAARVTLTGILPQEFGVSEAALTKSPSEDVLARRLEPSGSVQEGDPVYVEFLNLNHLTPIVGSIQRFPLQANVCYDYGTIATTLLCSRENILNPDENNPICLISEDKAVANSGAPVQVSSVRETARALDKIGFTFKVVHAGQGDIYESRSGCNKLERRFEDKVQVAVSTGIPGLVCSGLQGGTQGVVSLYGGEKTITCTQTLPNPADFEFPVTIELFYGYEERVNTEIVVKRSDNR